MNQTIYPVGKLPAQDLGEILRGLPPYDDPQLLQGPGVGLDCAILDFGETLLVLKTDPITFATDNIGWYAVHVNANDLATTGAEPRWFMATILLPEGQADRTLANQIFDQISRACASLHITLAGGHTEITAGLPRPVVAGAMIGTVSRDRLISPTGLKPGDRILLTKGIPIEAASILSNEVSFEDKFSPEILSTARDYLYDPGISVVADARFACEVGGVTAMHDPTEGGILTGLIELADAGKVALNINTTAIHILPEAGAICRVLDVNPLEAIASGALLIAADPEKADLIIDRLMRNGISAAEIGSAARGKGVWLHEGGEKRRVALPARDAIARLFEKSR